MDGIKSRCYSLDGDTLEIQFSYDAAARVWIGDYPYFTEEIRRTPSGRLWRNASHCDCPHAEHPLRDCGTCPHFVRQQEHDLIGVCYHEALRSAAPQSG